MKTYTFTTRDSKKQDVETYTFEGFNIKEAKKYAKNIIGNSRDNEVSHSRITLK